MSLLISIIIAIVILGLVLWLVNSYLPIAPQLKTVINVIAVLIVIIWLASAAGFLNLGR